MPHAECKARDKERARELEKLQRKIQDLMEIAGDLNAPDVREALTQAMLAANEALSEAMREEDEGGGSGDGRGVYERSKLSDSRPLDAKTAPEGA